jgi:hypothetical protein
VEQINLPVTQDDLKRLESGKCYIEDINKDIWIFLRMDPDKLNQIVMSCNGVEKHLILRDDMFFDTGWHPIVELNLLLV